MHYYDFHVYSYISRPEKQKIQFALNNGFIIPETTSAYVPIFSFSIC